MSYDTCPPTAPTTPVPPRQYHIFDRGQSKNQYHQPPSPGNTSQFRVPILAPPPRHLIPKAHRIKEDAAIERLRALSEREQVMRESDALGGGIYYGKWVKSSEAEEDMDEDDEWDDEDISYAAATAEVSTITLTGRPYRLSDSYEPSPAPAESKRSLGIDDNFRTTVMEWFFYVRIPISLHTSHTLTHPASQVIPTRPSPSGSKPCHEQAPHLYDQLSTSPETRFHAAYIFLRYLLHLFAEDGAHSILQDLNMETQPAMECVIWDIAVASLALSVKARFPSLSPFYPQVTIYLSTFYIYRSTATSSPHSTPSAPATSWASRPTRWATTNSRSPSPLPPS